MFRLAKPAFFRYNENFTLGCVFIEHIFIIADKHNKRKQLICFFADVQTIGINCSTSAFELKCFPGLKIESRLEKIFSKRLIACRYQCG